MYVWYSQTAEEEYEEAIRLHPGYPEAHLDLARLLASTSHGQKLTYGYTKGKRSEKVNKFLSSVIIEVVLSNVFNYTGTIFPSTL